jgi:hypothetical protein
MNQKVTCPKSQYEAVKTVFYAWKTRTRNLAHACSVTSETVHLADGGCCQKSFHKNERAL